MQLPSFVYFGGRYNNQFNEIGTYFGANLTSETHLFGRFISSVRIDES